MKNAIKIAVFTVSLIFISAIFISAQEHGQMNKDVHHTRDAKKNDKNNDGIIYECPMKCEEASDKAGECSKCGMDLKKVSVTESSKEMNEHMNHKMHNHSDHKNIDKNGDGVIYECPMKYEEASDKAGECSKCGMNLKEKKIKG